MMDARLLSRPSCIKWWRDLALISYRNFTMHQLY